MCIPTAQGGQTHRQVRRETKSRGRFCASAHGEGYGVVYLREMGAIRGLKPVGPLIR